MADAHCSNCLYFIDHHMMGQCRRFPLYQNRHKTEWCGEHKAPIVPETEEAKRRGRPPRQLIPLTVQREIPPLTVKEVKKL
jgi:hypothetical protein